MHRSLRPLDDYDSLCLAISNINWTQTFSQYRRSNDFATRFTNLLSETIVSCTKYFPSYRRQRLPRHIVHLLRAKKKAWIRAKCTGNITLFKTTCRVARAALRLYRRNEEERLIYSNNRNLLFSYINNAVTNNKSNTVQLCTNGTALTDIESYDAFLDVFSEFLRHKQYQPTYLSISERYACIFQLYTNRCSSCSTILS